MMKTESRRQRKVARVDEDSISESASSGDQLRGEARSKSREDPALQRRAGHVATGKEKGFDLQGSVGEYVVRHRCAFEAICG